MHIRAVDATLDSAGAALNSSRALAALRESLRASYPTFRASKLVAIAKEHGLHSFPEGFLVAGDLDDTSSGGPGKLLRKVAKGDSASEERLHPLFSARYYLADNPDLANAGVSAWLHYQTFGRLEERSPHPLIDLKYLANGLGDVAAKDLIDEYLARPVLWVIDPSPYVDCVRFTLFGEWDGQTNPLVQIVMGHLRSRWVHERLMLIDAVSDATAQARLTAVGFLLTRNSGINRFSQIAIWRRNDTERVVSDSQFTVVPGFFLGTASQELISLANATVSPDSSVMLLKSEAVGIISGSHHHGETLHYIDGWVGRETLAQLIAGMVEPAVIAPYSKAQEISLRQLRRDLGKQRLTVIEHGVQAQVTAKNLAIVAGRTEPLSPAVWNWRETAEAGSISVVLSESHRLRATGDVPLRGLLASGASLCLVGELGLNSWLPQLQARSIAIVDESLVNDVASFISADAIYLLPQQAFRSR